VPLTAVLGEPISARHHQGVRQHDGFVWCPIELEGMLPIDLETGGQHYAFLGRAGEDVAARLWASIEPIGIVERASTQAQDIRKSLEIEAEGRAAPAAEVQRDALPATIRLVLVGPRSRSGEDDIFLLKDWLDQVRRSCKPLAEIQIVTRSGSASVL
jgi:hypothetical protein